MSSRLFLEDVVASGDRREVLHIAVEPQFDVKILDLRLPRLSGFDKGTIEFHDFPGGGAQFPVRLPAVPEAA